MVLAAGGLFGKFYGKQCLAKIQSMRGGGSTTVPDLYSAENAPMMEENQTSVLPQPPAPPGANPQV